MKPERTIKGTMQGRVIPIIDASFSAIFLHGKEKFHIGRVLPQLCHVLIVPQNSQKVSPFFYIFWITRHFVVANFVVGNYVLQKPNFTGNCQVRRKTLKWFFPLCLNFHERRKMHQKMHSTDGWKINCFSKSDLKLL